VKITHLFLAIVLVFVSSSLFAADLLTRFDCQHAVYQRMESDSTDNYFDSNLVHLAVSIANNQVQMFMQCNAAQDTITMVAHQYEYDAPDSIAQNGVLFAFLEADTAYAPAGLRSLPYVVPDNFAKQWNTMPTEFTIHGTKLYVGGTMHNDGRLTVCYYKLSSHLTGPASNLGVPQEYRDFVLDLAVAYLEGIRKGLDWYLQQKTSIFALLREYRKRFPKADAQPVLGGQ